MEALTTPLLSQRDKSHLIIHSCALGAAGWSAAWGSVPIMGVTPDTAGLIGICSTMGGLLAHNHGMRYSDLKFMAGAAAIAQYVAGALIIKGLAGMIPVVGTVVNATVSLATVEAIGWGLDLILRDGKTMADLTKQEIRQYMVRGQSIRDQLKDDPGVQWLHGLPREVKRRLRILTKELTREGITEHRRAQILDLIEDLLRPHRPGPG